MPYDINGKPIDVKKDEEPITTGDYIAFIAHLTILLGLCAVPVMLVLLVLNFIESI